MGKIKGIRKRWMLNSISAVLLIVLFAVAAFSTAMASYYYSSMSTNLSEKVKFPTGSYKSESTYLQAARTSVEYFTEKDVLELQFISALGSVDTSTSELTPTGSYPGTPDIAKALSLKSMDVRQWTGTSPETGERVMSVSAPVFFNGMVVGAMRVVTSLSRVDRQVILVVAIALLVGSLIVAMVYLSNLYFVRSIVEPVADVTETAKRIAGGSYGIQMEKKFDDEIGDLTDAINDMSMKINQSEK